MSAPVICPKCGTSNAAGWTFCTNCGTPLAPSLAPPPAVAGAPPAGPPAYGPPPAGYPAYPTYPAYPPGYPAYPGVPPYAYGPPPWEADRRRQIDRTKTGILLLLVGALISWIPYVGFIGSLLTLIGAILVIVGRKAFGNAHRRNVVVSIVLVIVGLIFAFVGAFIAVVAALSGVNAGMTESQLAPLLSNAIVNVLIVAAIASFITGLASVFFTYALQKREGRIVLWAAYAATIGVQIAILVAVLPIVPDLARTMAHEIVTTGQLNSTEITDLVSGATTGLNLLNVIPAMLYAAANYLVWGRINKGEIPEPMTPPVGAPMAGPPAPPAPPMPPM